MSDSTRTGLPAMHGGTGAAPVTRDTGAETSLGAALSAVTRDISTLMQQEVALAKAEVRQSVNRAAQSVGMFAGAAVAAFLVVLFISVALWWAIGDSTGLGWAALIVAGVWAVAGAVLSVGEEATRADRRAGADNGHVGQGAERVEGTRGEEPMTDQWRPGPDPG